MDLLPIFIEAFSALWWLAALAILLGLLKTPLFKGYFGEWIVRFAARLALPRDTYHPAHDLTLPTPDGTTQIDHIYISRHGIFVVETKNMKGWILGTANQNHWTQSIYKRQFRFQNPLRQNYKHVKALQAALQVPDDTIHSVVTFVGNSTFITEIPENVTKGTRFIGYIRSFRDAVFTETEVEALRVRLEAARLPPGRSTNRRHVSARKQRADPSAERLCPRCCNPLVVRTARKGPRAGKSFWGCSAYPGCRLIQDME